MKHAMLLAAGLCLAALPVAAQDADPASEMERQTRNVGLAVGKAYGCLGADDARRERVKVGAKAIYHMILHDLGADLAYAFATSAGFGAGGPRNEADCEALAARWEAIQENFDLSTLFDGEDGE